MGNKLTISNKGVDFIANFEGFRDKAYQDSGGLWTIGYGQRIKVDEYPNGITQDQAKALLFNYLQKECDELADLPFSGLFQYQIDAIVSLVYNIGMNYFVNQTSIYKRLITRSPDLSSWLWLVKDAKGHQQSGLVKRRNVELQLFIYGIY